MSELAQNGGDDDENRARAQREEDQERFRRAKNRVRSLGTLEDLFRRRARVRRVRYKSGTMNARICALLPYRYVPFRELVRTTSFDHAPDGAISLRRTERPRKKWGFGHDWDLVAHSPNGTALVCVRCDTTS